MLKEFKEFAMKGNMMDMAVGIIIGASFGAIIKSLVGDVLMPLSMALLTVFEETYLGMDAAQTKPEANQE